MKAEDLVKLIDKLVEKKLNAKVKQLIREEVSSQVNKVMGTMLVEMIKEAKTSAPAPQVESPIHTRNPKLNSVLAETARNFQPPKRGSLAELLDGGFDKIGEGVEEAYTNDAGSASPVTKPNEQDGTNISFLKSMVNEGVTIAPAQQSVLGTGAVPDSLKGVFNKNFRAVIQKMDEQKKYGTQGLINPMSIIDNNIKSVIVD